MRYINSIKKSLLLLLNIPYIPEELYTRGKGPFLLHISDTPEEIHGYIFNTIKKINPQYIVHTGDIVDNIKLETYKNKKMAYAKALKGLVHNMENTGARGIYYAVGNHDDVDILRETIKQGRILGGKETFTIGEYSFYATHYYQEKRPSASFHLFGHSFTPGNKKDDGEIILNGTLNMHAIDLSTGEVYYIPYPLGTNQFRKMERARIGI